MNTERIKHLIKTCNIHKTRLKTALINLEKIIPMTISKYETLKDQEISFIDQMSYRFGKLQDSAGRLLKWTLDALGEEVYELTFIDILNLSEKLGIIDSAKEWLTLRELRNLITHEYSDKTKDIVEGINQLFEASRRLIEIYDKIYRYLSNRGIME